MRISDISLIGWFHTSACIVALILGAWNIVAVKGSAVHKLRGLGYVVSMVVANILSLAIYRFDLDFAAGGRPGAGVFGLFHWLAVASLFFTLAGYYAASHQGRALWAYLHPVCMTLSYYLLVGGLINELYARVAVLRPLAVTMINGKPVFGSQVLGMTHFSNMLVTFFLIILFSIKVWLYRRR